MTLVVFDKPMTWEASLAEALGKHFMRRLTALKAPHLFIEDARNALLAEERNMILHATLSWLGSNTVAAYHGTRLNSDELKSVRTKGLVPLTAQHRIARLERSLSAHPDWPSVAPQLLEAIKRGGRGIMIGNRIGQAHLTLSESALANHFNHYLSHGSEFDQHIANQLLGQEGVELLSKDGGAYVVEFSVPGPAAIVAAHRYFSAEEMIKRGEIPNLVKEFLGVLSYRVHQRSFDPIQLGTDCGLVFTSTIPAEWIQSIVAWPLSIA